MNFDASFLYEIGHGFQSDGKHHRAVEFLNQSIEKDASNSKAFESRAVSLFQIGEVQKAFNDLDKAIELDPENHDALYNKASLLIRQENTERP